jgi:hypothetical protein
MAMVDRIRDALPSASKVQMCSFAGELCIYIEGNEKKILRSVGAIDTLGSLLTKLMLAPVGP